MKRYYLLLTILLIFGCSQIPVNIDMKYWTIMVYASADCNLEPYLLTDVEELKRGTKNNVNIVVLMDRSVTYSEDASVFGENFSDTRLYQVLSNNCFRLDGEAEFPEITRSSNYEANLGDPNTLKKFINFCKAQYPADNYALVMGGHGDGTRSLSSGETSRAISYDENDSFGNSDMLYTGEITDNLTSKESVNLLVLDACLMGTIEVAYQFRPNIDKFGSDYLVASPPNIWARGLNYDAILSKIGYSGSGSISPVVLNPVDFGKIIINEQTKVFEKYSDYTLKQALSLFDLSKVVAVKASIDDLSKSIYSYKTETIGIRDSAYDSNLIAYFNLYSGEWQNWAYFDLYDLCEKIGNNAVFSVYSQKVSTALNNIDEFVVASYAGDYFSNFNFKTGKNGVSIFFPNGEAIINGTLSWSEQLWYNAIHTQDVFGSGDHYGALDWCADGATSGNNIVENWFELLDSFFDETNDATGGVNGYQY